MVRACMFLTRVSGTDLDKSRNLVALQATNRTTNFITTKLVGSDEWT